MTDNADYRLYLEVQFEQLHEKLDEIKEQVTKTNGRVTELEKCHAEKRLDKLEEELRDVGFFARHPKMFVGLIVVLVVLALVGGLGNVISKFI
jgi:hypothetical protein